MSRVELIYYEGCPHVVKARMALRDAEIGPFVEIEQGTLPLSDERKSFSSPSIVINGVHVIGKKNSAFTNTPDIWNEVSFILKDIIKKKI